MFPGLRVGLAVLPPSIIDIFQKYKMTTDIDSSMISQAALYLYLKNGMFEHNKTKVSNIYHTRAKILHQSIQDHLSTYESSSEIVMHSHIVLPKRVNLKSFVYHLHEEGIYLDTVERNYLDDFYHERILKLNVSNVGAHRIEEGIRKIASALENPQNYFL